MKLLSNINLYRARLKIIKKTGQPILIWNMGKVASTSIAKSLWKTHGRHNILTTHFMNDPQHPRSVAIYEELIRNYGGTIPIITLTRLPIERNISSFFQNFEQNTGFKIDSTNYSNSELIEIFLNKFKKHNVTLEWFDNNFLRYLNFNVYSELFDKSNGFKIYEHGRFRILVLRSEDSDEIKSSAISEFLSIENFKLQNSNIGSSKPYSNAYEEFKRSVQLSQDYIDEMLNSKYTQQFYSIEEINACKSGWNSHISKE